MPTAIKAMCTAKTGRALGFLGDPQSANRECGRRGRVISQFRLHGNRGHYEDRGSLWPPWSHEMSGQKIMHRNSNSKYQLRCLNTLSQCIQVMVGKGTSKRHVGFCPSHTDQAHGSNSHMGPQATVFLRLSQEASQRPVLRSVALYSAL